MSPAWPDDSAKTSRIRKRAVTKPSWAGSSCGWKDTPSSAAIPLSGQALRTPVPEDWLEKIPGVFLAGVHVVMENGSPPDTFGPVLAAGFEG